jgi:hypothetical protein
MAGSGLLWCSASLSARSLWTVDPHYAQGLCWPSVITSRTIFPRIDSVRKVILALAGKCCKRASHLPPFSMWSYHPSHFIIKSHNRLHSTLVNLRSDQKLLLPSSNPQACTPTSAKTLVTPSLSPSPAGNSQTRPKLSASALRPWQLHFLVRL